MKNTSIILFICSLCSFALAGPGGSGGGVKINADIRTSLDIDKLIGNDKLQAIVSQYKLKNSNLNIKVSKKNISDILLTSGNIVRPDFSQDDKATININSAIVDDIQLFNGDIIKFK